MRPDGTVVKTNRTVIADEDEDGNTFYFHSVSSSNVNSNRDSFNSFFGQPEEASEAPEEASETVEASEADEPAEKFDEELNDDIGDVTVGVDDGLLR